MSENQIPVDNRPSDEEIIRYERKIKEEEVANTPLVSDLVDFTDLEKEYENGADIFKSKIDYLKQTCKYMRTVRKDGNCFYRAFAFRFCEILRTSHDQPWASAVLEKARSSRELLTQMGYDMSLLQDFYEPFEEAMSKESVDMLQKFQTDYESDTIVCYLRIITAALLKRDRDMYEAFILDSNPSLEDFIATSVEPMNVESDQIHIVAIANIFGLKIRVANLDLSVTSTGINHHDIEPMDTVVSKDMPTVHLLYRPGHYDILYPTE